MNIEYGSVLGKLDTNISQLTLFSSVGQYK